MIKVFKTVKLAKHIYIEMKERRWCYLFTNEQHDPTFL
jgi:hypothetical protein